MNARRQKVEETYLEGRKSNQATRDAKRTRRQRHGASRMSGSGRRSCRTRQNASTNALSEGVEETHQVDWERSRTSQAARRPHQMVTRATQNVPEASATSASMKRTHQVDIEPLEAIEASRSRREPSRAIRTAKTLSTTPNTMGCVPAAAGTSAKSKRTREIEETDRECIGMSRRRRKASRAIGGARAKAKAT